MFKKRGPGNDVRHTKSPSDDRKRIRKITSIQPEVATQYVCGNERTVRLTRLPQVVFLSALSSDRQIALLVS